MQGTRRRSGSIVQAILCTRVPAIYLVLLLGMFSIIVYSFAFNAPQISLQEKNYPPPPPSIPEMNRNTIEEGEDKIEKIERVGFKQNKQNQEYVGEELQENEKDESPPLSFPSPSPSPPSPPRNSNSNSDSELNTNLNTNKNSNPRYTEEPKYEESISNPNYNNPEYKNNNNYNNNNNNYNNNPNYNNNNDPNYNNNNNNGYNYNNPIPNSNPANINNVINSPPGTQPIQVNINDLKIPLDQLQSQSTDRSSPLSLSLSITINLPPAQAPPANDNNNYNSNNFNYNSNFEPYNNVYNNGNNNVAAPSTPPPETWRPNIWPYPTSYDKGDQTVHISSKLLDNIKTIFVPEQEEEDSPIAKFVSNAVNMYKQYIFPEEVTEPESDTAIKRHILANDAVSVLRALETLSQITNRSIGSGGLVSGFHINDAPIQIYDKPAFEYRGILVDTARKYYRVSTLKKIIDGLMQLKMNALHWHLTDNEGFSLGSISHPEINNNLPKSDPVADSDSKLKRSVENSENSEIQETYGNEENSEYNSSENGKNSGEIFDEDDNNNNQVEDENGEPIPFNFNNNQQFQPDTEMKNPKFYTHEEISEVVAYAKARGVQVIPEIDMPAHVHSWSFAYPGITVPVEGADCDLISPLNIFHPDVFGLIKDFLTEENELFPGKFMHLGGDEISYNCISQNPDFMAQLLELNITNNNTPPYWNHFWSNMLTIFNNVTSNKTPIIWDEWIGEAKGDYLGWKPIIEIWRGTPELEQATKEGLKAPEGCVSWFDCYNHHPHHYITDQFTNDRHVLPENQKELVIGGEAAAWELTEQCFHGRVWHRLVALSERLWSNPDFNEYYGTPSRNPAGYSGCDIIDTTEYGPKLSTTQNSLLELRYNNHSLRLWERQDIATLHKEALYDENLNIYH